MKQAELSMSPSPGPVPPACCTPDVPAGPPPFPQPVGSLEVANVAHVKQTKTQAAVLVSCRRLVVAAGGQGGQGGQGGEAVCGQQWPGVGA